MRIKSKFWLEDEHGEPVFGEGRRRILELIDELGSMQAAAKTLNMSYRGVWARIKATEQRLGIKLVDTAVGRSKDRGSRLTSAAQKLMAEFRLITEKGTTWADEMFAAVQRGEVAPAPTGVPALAVIGPAGSGKTKLIAALVAAWQKIGWRVGVIRLEPEAAPWAEADRDTFDAGALCQIVAGPDRLHVALPGGLVPVPEIVADNYALGCDLVLVESRQRVHLPTIELFSLERDQAPLTRRGKDLWAVVGDQPPGREQWPHFESADLAGLIEHLKHKLSTIKSSSGRSGRDQVNLMADGHRVPMVPFVRDLVANVVLGMVTSLKSCEQARDITISVRRTRRGKDEPSLKEDQPDPKEEV